MAARESRYYGNPFKAYRGVTQEGEGGFPHLFKFPFNVLVRQWGGLVMENEAGPEGFVHAVMEKSAFFYTEDGLVVSTNPVWLQCSFNMMIGLFGRVGLCINMAKKVVMV